MKTKAQNQMAWVGQNYPNRKAQLSSQVEDRVEIMIFDLEGEEIDLRFVKVDQLAHVMKNMWLFDLEIGLRCYYRVTCGEWTADYLTPRRVQA